MRKKIKHKIPDAHQTATSAPLITSVLSLLRDEFNADDIDNDPYDTEFCSDSDLDLSDDDDLEPRYKRSRTIKKKIISGTIPTGAMDNSQVSSTLDALAAQFQAELQAVKDEQATLLRELTAMAPATAYTTSNDDPQSSFSRTTKFAGIQLHSVDVLADDVYAISSSPPWRPVRSDPPSRPMDPRRAFMTPREGNRTEIRANDVSPTASPSSSMKSPAQPVPYDNFNLCAAMSTLITKE